MERGIAASPSQIWMIFWGALNTNPESKHQTGDFCGFLLAVHDS
jgi:hypothetical protein